MNSNNTENKALQIFLASINSKDKFMAQTSSTNEVSQKSKRSSHRNRIANPVKENAVDRGQRSNPFCKGVDKF